MTKFAQQFCPTGSPAVIQWFTWLHKYLGRFVETVAKLDQIANVRWGTRWNNDPLRTIRNINSAMEKTILSATLSPTWTVNALYGQVGEFSPSREE